MRASLAIYRSGLMLNNMSISMLQRGFLEEALDTINQSLVMLQRAFSDSSSSSSWTPRAARQMQKASARCAKASRNQEVKFCFDVLPVDEEDLSSIEHAAKYGRSASVFFPVRFNEGPSMDSTPHDTSRQLAIVLFNQGLIHYLVACHCPNRGAKLLDSAQKSLRMSQLVFGRTVENESMESCDLILSILLSTIVLNCLSQVYWVKNMKVKVEEVKEAVLSLQARMKGFDWSTLFQRTEAAAAA